MHLAWKISFKVRILYLTAEEQNKFQTILSLNVTNAALLPMYMLIAPMTLVIFYSFSVMLVRRKWSNAAPLTARRSTACPTKNKKPFGKDRATAMIFLKRAVPITFFLRKISGILLKLQKRHLFKK